VTFAIALVACAPPPTDPLLAMRDRGDRAAMRAHGWALWQALMPAAAAPAWASWTPSDQLFGGAPAGGAPKLRKPRPFRIGDAVERETLPVMFDIVFNRSAAAHVHANHLDRAATLRALAEVPAFPTDAIAMKLTWYPVRAHGLTAMPIWDGAPGDDGAPAPDRDWPRAIAVDPSRDDIPADEEQDGAIEAQGGATRRAHVVPLAAFVHHTLERDDELASARQATGDPTLERGDALALVAAHVSTKELPDWVWVTLWWHDRPDAGPFAEGRPAALSPDRAAAHYVMDVAFSSSAPCFNPWLEARFVDGTRSNCATCHQRAVVGATDYLPVTRAPLVASDPYFEGHPQTDFVWSLAFEAR